ncbi:flavodoxin family protein [Salidesulfovibrio onnuriiensis]|uniref:flavodoxin family protein n=1 Tax=Salidesulfovibrio onnuriiensis TaxID=2583823 RepID=UPI0011CA823F|nr:flavodoxin family protein [Salidesulfovibrio onnuriiensis]
MNVVTILGSPRKKGNSSSIARAFTETAQELGAQTRTYHLNSLDFRGCQGCYACKTKQETCILKDDLTEVLQAIHEADVVVMASPVYYWDVSGQFKSFVDRTYSFLRPDFFNRPDPCRLPAGKKGLLVLTQGAEAKEHQDVPQKYEHFMEFYGMTVRKTIRASAIYESASAQERDSHVREAEALAREWCG